MTFLVLFFLIFIIYWIYKLLSRQNTNSANSDDYIERWFGRDNKISNEEDNSIREFTIEVPFDILLDLKYRLEKTRFEEPVQDSLFHYGFNPKYLKQIVDYWIHKYDWVKQEKILNSFPHFKTKLEGLDIHFLHVKPQLTNDSSVVVIPLMIIHGWPGSFVEFLKLIPLLTTPQPDCPFVFEVVCPSIPGFGFSESPHQKGFDARACARVFVNLMARLEFPKFYVQGGDWGSIVASLIARYYPEKIIGLHVNMYFFGLQSWDWLKFLMTWMFPRLITPEEYKTIFPVKKFLKALLKESAYFHMQSTKPDTLGCAMSDSPAGMAAYLLEKFGVATCRSYLNREDGGLTQKFTLDELLTNVMIYWVNNNFTAAARFYKENIKSIANAKHEKIPVKVPCGIALFPNEVLMFPRNMLSQQIHDLVSYNIMPKGGHFAALEEPHIFAQELRNFVSKVENRKQQDIS